MSTLIRWGAAFIAALFQQWMARLKRDSDMRDQGKAATLQEASDAADQRKEDARKSDENWGRLTADERERLRNDRNHYRD